MKNIISKRYIVTTILASMFILALVAVMGATWPNSDVLADATSWAGSHAGSNGCANPNTTGTWQDECTGASWRKYSVSELKDPSGRSQRDGSWYFSQDDSKSEWPSVLKAKCEAIGATEVYRLGLETFDAGNGSFRNLQGGVKEVYEMSKAGGRLTFIEPGTSGLSGLQLWKDVEDAFKIAASVDEGGNGTTVDGNSWEQINSFCYNPEWKDSKKKGEFESETFLETSTGKKFQSGTDSRTTETLDEIDTESITLTFYHKIRYKFSGSLSTGTKIDDASTDWAVYDKFDGGKQTGSGTVTVKPGSEAKYESEKLQEEKVEVKLEEGEEETVCRLIEYSPKTIEFKYDRKAKTYKADPAKDENDSGICVTVKRKKDDEEEEEPKTGTNSKKFDAYFDSRSEVSSIANNFDIMANTEDSGFTEVENGKKSAEIHYFFSTDRDTAKVKFAHYLKWDKAMFDVDEAIEISEIKSKEDEPKGKIARKVKINGKVIDTETKIGPDGTTDHPYAATIYEIENDPSGITGDKPSGSSSATGNGLKKSATPTECSADKTQCGSNNGADGTQIWVSEEYEIKLDNVDELYAAMSKIKFDSTVQMEIKENLVAGTKWMGDYEDVLTEDKCKEKDVVCTLEAHENGAGFQDQYTYTDKTGPHPGNVREKYKFETTSNGLVRESWELKVVKVKDATASSEAHAEVVRPGDPIKSSEIPGPTNDGVPSATIKYAGEGSELVWKAKTGIWGARKVVEYQSVAFLLKVNEQFGEDKIKGNIVSKDADASTREKAHENQKDPCDWYKSSGHFVAANVVWCNKVTDQTYSPSANINTKDQWWHATPNKQASRSKVDAKDAKSTIIVPNDVGRKYCHSNGYHWQYFYGTSEDGNWYKFKEVTGTSRNQYWTNYDAACKTIAKKPSVAFWNGGVFMPGSIVTSLSLRSDAADKDSVKSPTPIGNNDFKLYGSWTEYVAAIGGAVDGFASGATLSRGNIDGDIAGYSPLTIANMNGSLGGSQISTNNALMTRLQSYFKSSTAPVSQVTRVITNGSITDDVIYDGPYNSIYQIPRTIYLVNGDVNISKDVTRLDAWIIATGTVNTCAEFKEGKYPGKKGDANTTSTFGIKVDNPNNSGAACDKKLTINGPVIAQNVKLNRTFGADPQRAYANPPDESNFYTPAEVFNLSAENYLWAYAQAGRYKSSYTDAYARELPPRY